MAIKNWKAPDENEGFVDFMLQRDEQQDSQTDSSNSGSNSSSSAKKVSSSSATNRSSKKGELSAINSMSDRLYVKLDSIDSNVQESNDQLRVISKYSEDSSIWLSEIYDLLDLNGRDRSKNKDTSKDGMQTKAENVTGQNPDTGLNFGDLGAGIAGSLGLAAALKKAAPFLKNTAKFIGKMLPGALFAYAAIELDAEVKRQSDEVAKLVAGGMTYTEAWGIVRQEREEKTEEFFRNTPILKQLMELADFNKSLGDSIREYFSGSEDADKVTDNPDVSSEDKSLLTELYTRAEQRNINRESGIDQSGNRDRQDQDVVSMQLADKVSTTSTSPVVNNENKSLATDIKDRGEEKNRQRETLGSSDANPENRDRQGSDLKSMQWADAMKVSSNGEGGRSAAESYLGRKMSDEEYDYLVRATHAEASAGKNADPKEQAMIMASILNRARDMGKNGVIEALTAKNQFQSVTGTSANDNAPSENFTQGPDADRKNSIESSAAMLGGISRDQENFTAASSGAYGAGTNIGYRDDMIASGGTQIGGSVFNTAGPQDMGSYSPVDAAQQKSAGGEEDKDAAGGLTTIRTASGKTAQVGAAYASNLQGFITDLEGTGYKINSLGGYANRANVNNPSVKSYHAMGAAIDINPEQNPNNSTKSDLPPETGALAAKHGLGWGMNWKSVKDPMHFSAAKSEQGSFDIKRASIGPGEVQGGAAPGGGGKSDATVASKSSAGSGAPSTPAAGSSKASGGIASTIGSIGKFAGNLIGDLSKSTSMKSATSQVAATSSGSSSGGSTGSSSGGSSKLPTGGSSSPLVAIDNMFAKLFDESAMFG